VPLSRRIFAMDLVQSALDAVGQLPDSAFKNHGDQQSLIALLRQLFDDVEDRRFEQAEDHVELILRKSGELPAVQSQLNAVLSVLPEDHDEE
jgi:hypothetical protein